MCEEFKQDMANAMIGKDLKAPISTFKAILSSVLDNPEIVRLTAKMIDSERETVLGSKQEREDLMINGKPVILVDRYRRAYVKEDYIVDQVRQQLKRGTDSIIILIDDIQYRYTVEETPTDIVCNFIMLDN